MNLIKLLLMATFILSISSLWADKEPRQLTFVKSAEGGRYYFKMIADDDYDRSKGRGKLYQVSSEGKDKVLWETKGWFAFDLYISYDGNYLARLGNWPRGRKPSHKDLGIAFYKNGKLIKYYSTVDLVQNLSKIEKTKGHYSYLKKVLGFTSTYDYMFQIVTIDNILYTFNVSDGSVISRTKWK